ncbi:MAG TPA: DUF4190 domain-containing protein [Acidimicrobiales bacterium]
MSETPTTPAGWYADPTNPGMERWWDGQEWHERFRPAEGVGISGAPGVPGPAQGSSVNGLAIASMVLGIVWLWWLGSILALIFGYIAKRRIDESQGRQTGRGMAVAGIVLGWIGVAFLVLIIVIAIAASDSTVASVN